jgi:hypothetical protein
MDVLTHGVTHVLTLNIRDPPAANINIVALLRFASLHPRQINFRAFTQELIANDQFTRWLSCPLRRHHKLDGILTRGSQMLDHCLLCSLTIMPFNTVQYVAMFLESSFQASGRFRR